MVEDKDNSGEYGHYQYHAKLKGKEVNPAQVSVNYGPNDGFGGWEPVIDEVLNKDFETFHTEKETIIPQYSSGDIVQTKDGPLYRAKDIANTFYSINNTEDKDDEPKYDLNENFNKQLHDDCKDYGKLGPHSKLNNYPFYHVHPEPMNDEPNKKYCLDIENGHASFQKCSGKQSQRFQLI